MQTENNYIQRLQCWYHMRYLVEALEEQLHVWFDHDPHLIALADLLSKTEPEQCTQPRTLLITKPPYRITLYDLLPKCNHCDQSVYPLRFKPIV